jgi:hypothetical protein
MIVRRDYLREALIEGGRGKDRVMVVNIFYFHIFVYENRIMKPTRNC